MLYFAYGSNMCTGRLRCRVPSAQFVCVAKLPGHTFRFQKRSTDGSAKGDALETGDAQDVVWGVVFDIADREKPALDDAEGMGAGYLEKTATVIDEAGQEHQGSLYYADAGHIDAAWQPYSWYKHFVVDGARQHALPGTYVDAIAPMPDIADPNRERDTRNRAITC
jgi:gamma-glutamylcyclotransferase